MPRTVESCPRLFRAAVVTGAAMALALLTVLPFASAPAAAAASEVDPYAPVYGRRGESSVGILFGVGWYENTDFNEALAGLTPPVDPIENGFEYGIQYRRRIRHAVSLGAELGRLDGRTSTDPGGVGSEFGMAGTMLFLDAFVHPLQAGPVALTLFAGGGPVFGIRLSQTYPDGQVAEGQKTGFGWHAGAEGEARFGEYFGFFVRGMTREAGASDIIVSDDPAGLIRFDADFDGLAVSFGPRWYWGGQGKP